MYCINDDSSSTRRPFQLTAGLVRPSVTAADRTPVTGVGAWSVAGVADGSLTGGVQQTAFTGATAQLTASQTTYTAAAQRPRIGCYRVLLPVPCLGPRRTRSCGGAQTLEGAAREWGKFRSELKRAIPGYATDVL